MNAFKFSTFIQLLTDESQTLKPACEGDLTFSDHYTLTYLCQGTTPLFSPGNQKGQNGDRFLVLGIKKIKGFPQA